MKHNFFCLSVELQLGLHLLLAEVFDLRFNVMS
jgi:hypothetical protein